MFPLKPLSMDAVEGALAKAERYRLLNEPGEAESICRDVLQVDPGNQPARIALILSLTDQFDRSPGVYREAHDLASALRNDYELAYYKGIVNERRAKAQLSRGGPGAGLGTFEWLMEAMHCFEQAEAVRPPGNDDALLRWNACARLLNSHPELRSSAEERVLDMLE
jgi:hypothetical protein